MLRIQAVHKAGYCVAAKARALDVHIEEAVESAALFRSTPHQNQCPNTKPQTPKPKTPTPKTPNPKPQPTNHELALIKKQPLIEPLLVAHLIQRRALSQLHAVRVVTIFGIGVVEQMKLVLSQDLDGAFAIGANAEAQDWGDDAEDV